MKRIIVLLCVFSMLASFSLSVYANSNGNENSIELTEQENAVLRSQLIERDYGEENFQSEILYDPDGLPSIMLGTTTDGYLIWIVKLMLSVNAAKAKVHTLNLTIAKNTLAVRCAILQKPMKQTLKNQRTPTTT